MTRTFRYDWYGAAVGVGLPLVGTVIEALHQLGSVAPRALLDAHLGQPLLWIMDTTPFVLGGLGSVIVRQHRDIVAKSDELVAKSNEIVRLEEEKRRSLDDAAAEVFHAAGALLGTVDDFTRITAATADAVRDTTTTLTQLSQAASAAALKAETVIGVAQRSDRESARGLDHVEGASAELLQLAEDVRGLSTQIESLSTRMREVFEVATVLAEVAERSERVAREAERADGAPGRLAQDARALSRDTARAAEEARGFLADVQQAMLSAISAAGGGSARAQAGARVAAETRDIIRVLSGALGDSARAAREIARAAQQQEGGIEQVVKAMSAIALSAHETSTSTQHVAREARALEALAASLRAAVKR